MRPGRTPLLVIATVVSVALSLGPAGSGAGATADRVVIRADIRGRTLPNFIGESMNWPEITGGVTFSWGER